MKLHVAGDLRVPGDKSITHRALMLAGAARGRSRLSGLLTGEDCQSTASVLRALGVTVPPPPADGGEIVVEGSGLDGWRPPAAVLDCGNSGTTARLMLGLLAGRPFRARLTGDASLRSRPMRRVTVPLAEMGAEFRELELPDRLPLEITGGALRGIRHASAQASAQVKSAILLAGVSGGVPVSVLEPHRSRDHTERMLGALGAPVESVATADGWLVRAPAPAAHLAPLDLRVPGDPSSAAFLIALALLADTGELRIRDVCVNPTRAGFLRVLRRMGASVRLENERDEGGEPVADLVAGPAELHGVEIVAEEIPALIDEIPILAALAVRARGETRISGAAELRAKESDRIVALVENLRAIGVAAEELPDGLVVQGTEAPLSGEVLARHDHRIAMAFAVLGSLPGNRISVDTPEVSAVSFPAFGDTIRGIVSHPSVSP